METKRLPNGSSFSFFLYCEINVPLIKLEVSQAYIICSMRQSALVASLQ